MDLMANMGYNMNISQERFEKAKKKIIKKYPGAHTRIDPNGKYFVATKNHLIKKAPELSIPREIPPRFQIGLTRT